jgi:hypothetical protein
MSPYGYDYSLAPRATTGWRSRFTTVVTVGALVAISAVSGAAVALNLLGPAGTPADRPAIFAMHAPAASAPVAAQTLMPAAPQPAKATVAVAPSQAPPAAVHPASPPAAAPAPQPAPAVAAVEPAPTAHVSDSELTFSRGYARRRAIQIAADAVSAPRPAGPATEVARVETQGQFGRAARKAKAIAHTNTTQDSRRVAEAREEGGPFSRFEQHEKFDFGRHQALAFGDSRDPRANRRPPPQGGGLFGNSPSGFFGGLF